MTNRFESFFKNQFLVTLIIAFFISCVFLFSSYSKFSTKAISNDYNVMKSGSLELSYVNETEGYGDILSLIGAYPMSDIEGIKNVPYRFSVTNTSLSSINYLIKLVSDDALVKYDNCFEKQLSPLFIKYKFDNNAPTNLNLVEQNGYVVYEGFLESGSTNIHEIRIWIDENSSSQALGKHFHGNVVIEEIKNY